MEAIRNNGCEVSGMVTAYTYGFDVAAQAFKAANVKLVTLTNYEAVVAEAVRIGYIDPCDVEVLNEWRKTRPIGTVNRLINRKTEKMSKQQFESNIKPIPYAQSCVYAKLADLNNLSVIKERFNDPSVRAMMSGQVPEDKLNQLNERIQEMTFDTDSVSCKISL